MFENRGWSVKLDSQCLKGSLQRGPTLIGRIPKNHIKLSYLNSTNSTQRQRTAIVTFNSEVAYKKGSDKRKRFGKKCTLLYSLRKSATFRLCG